MQRVLLASLFIILTSHSLTAQRACATYERLQHELEVNPSIAQKLAQVEAFIRTPKAIKTEAVNDLTGTGAGLPIIKIPVVFHIVYNTAAQNISDEQIQSQIDALNRDYRMQNEDTVN